MFWQVFAYMNSVLPYFEMGVIGVSTYLFDLPGFQVSSTLLIVIDIDLKVTIFRGLSFLI